VNPGKLARALNAAAEAAHDRFYHINAAHSEMGLAFETEHCKAEWREVVLAAIVALEEVEG
jgi:hypothetical protein